MNYLNVSELNEQIKSQLEISFHNIYVQGEISNITYHNSGHIYFSIKDKNSTLSCVMFRGNARYLKFRLELGLMILILGNITAYTPRGSYQLICSKIEPSGVGALSLAYEQLKIKLQNKGYFDKAIKKDLPKYPRNIYIITSNSGAAIEDMKKILSNRYPLAKIVLLPTLVQGINAKNEIANNIQRADKISQKYPKYVTENIIIISRGGGSLEDLWSFNEECVANAIYLAKTPIISAIGHENDFVISDFVADIRASTPSNAIEISTPDINDLRLFCDILQDDFVNKIKVIISQKEQMLYYLNSSFTGQSFLKRIEIVYLTILHLKSQFDNAIKQIINNKTNNIVNLIQNFDSNNPKNKDKKGFAQITKNNKTVELDKLQVDDIVELQNISTILSCKILSKQNI